MEHQYEVEKLNRVIRENEGINRDIQMQMERYKLELEGKETEISELRSDNRAKERELEKLIAKAKIVDKLRDEKSNLE